VADPELLAELDSRIAFPGPMGELEDFQTYIEKYFSPTGMNKTVIQEIFQTIEAASAAELSQSEQAALRRKKNLEVQYGDDLQGQGYLEELAIKEMQLVKIDDEDAAELLQEMFYTFAERYESLYPGGLTAGDVNFALPLILDEFLLEKEIRREAQKTEEGYATINRPERLEWSQQNTDQYKIWDILDEVYAQSEQTLALQPLYFTEASRFQAFLDAAEETGFATYEETHTQSFKDNIWAQWDQIQQDLVGQSTAANPAFKTIAKALIFKAQGRMGSKQDQIDYGYLDTMFSDSPLTKDRFKVREEARGVSTNLTESDLKAIMSNPETWIKEYYGNTLKYDFQIGTSDEGKAAYNRFVKEKGDLLQAHVRDLRTATDQTGALVYSPDDILQQAGMFADQQFIEAPDIIGIDQGVAYAEESEEAAEQRAEDEAAAQAEAKTLQTQRRISDYNIFQQAEANPDAFKKKYLGDPVFALQADDTLKRYKEEGMPAIDAATGEVKIDPVTKRPIYTSPQGITPSGKIEAFPDVTYRDPNTGEIKVLPAAEVPFNLGPGGLVPERLKPMLNWQYNLTPTEQFAMQTGAAPPSIPPNIMQSLMGPPSLRSDIYTTGPNDIRRPFFSNLPERDTSVFNPMLPGSRDMENYVESAPVFPSMGPVNMPGSSQAGGPYGSLLNRKEEEPQTWEGNY